MRSVKSVLSNTKLVLYLRENKNAIESIEHRLELLEKQNRELLFASIFRDSIQDSNWVTNKSFSAFQAAANYSLLYKLFKIYDIVKPQNILEFGLGQSTRLTGQYISAHSEAKALVIDDDEEWIRIYKSQISDTNRMRIKKLPVGDFKYEKISSEKGEYVGLESIIKQAKYNLIIVDGPVGHLREYSRTNIVSLIGNLAESWIVIFDDAERPGEQNTMNIFHKELRRLKIEYVDFEFSAAKSQHYFCSKDLARTVHDI